MKKITILKTFQGLLKYLIELSIVAFGVFLGFYIGERNNQKRTDQNTLNALTQIISELQSNAKNIEFAIEYHEKLSIELDSVTKNLTRNDYTLLFLENKERFNFAQMPSWKGYWVGHTNSIIFESSKISGVFNEFNIETIQIIAGIYEFQEQYAELGSQSLNKLLDMDSSTKVMDVIGLLERLVKNDIYSIEKLLLQEMKKSIEELEKIKEERSYKK